MGNCVLQHTGFSDSLSLSLNWRVQIERERERETVSVAQKRLCYCKSISKVYTKYLLTFRRTLCERHWPVRFAYKLTISRTLKYQKSSCHTLGATSPDSPDGVWREWQRSPVCNPRTSCLSFARTGEMQFKTSVKRLIHVEATLGRFSLHWREH